MFDPSRDERLRQIELEAGVIAFLTYFFLILGIMIVRGFVDVPVLSDPNFLLVAPWLFTGLVFFAVVVRKGYYAAVREENTRTRKRLLESRISVLLSTLMFGTGMFLFEYFDVFSDEQATLTEDLTDAATNALLFGAAMWFFLARKSRKSRAGQKPSNECGMRTHTPDDG